MKTLVCAALPLLLLVACESGTRPALSSVAAAANPRSALSSLVSLHSNVSGCAVITSTPADGGPAVRSACLPVAIGDNQLAAVGLLPNLSYAQQVALTAGGQTATADAGTFTTGDLPAALKTVTLQTSGAAFDGFMLIGVVVGTELWATAFDSSGRIRWYAELGAGGYGDLKQQPNGHFTAYVGASNGSNGVPSGNYLELQAGGALVDSYVAPPPLLTDNHELLLRTDPAGLTVAHFFGYQVTSQVLPFTQSEAPLASHSILRRDGNQTAFELPTNSFRSLADWIEPPFTASNADFDHPNSLQIDSRGNYLASYRALGEVDSIDASTGKVLWTLGGTHSTLRVQGDPEGFFSAQHYARLLPNGHLLLYDNGWRHSPQETRAVEYALDLNAGTATMVWQHHHSPAVFTPFMRSAQRLQNGNTVVGFSMSGLIDEVDKDDTIAWQGALQVEGGTPWFYRAIRIAALDEYRDP
jgi:outer membrane protein assembly factor BamB